MAAKELEIAALKAAQQEFHLFREENPPVDLGDIAGQTVEDVFASLTELFGFGTFKLYKANAQGVKVCVLPVRSSTAPIASNMVVTVSPGHGGMLGKGTGGNEGCPRTDEGDESSDSSFFDFPMKK